MKTLIKSLVTFFKAVTPISVSRRMMNTIDIDLVKYLTLGDKPEAYIRNGVGYGHISQESLYDNMFLEIGIGRIMSGYGDWGGGFDRATDSPVKITINKEWVIMDVSTESFYNSNQDSKRIEKKAEAVKLFFNVGEQLVIKDITLIEHVNELLMALPLKRHVGYDPFNYPHMLKTCLKNKKSYSFRDPKCLEVAS